MFVTDATSSRARRGWKCHHAGFPFVCRPASAMTEPRLRIALAQFDFPVAAIADNTRRIVQMMAIARDEHQADVVVFPELALSGCLAQDLLRQSGFLDECRAALQDIARAASGIVAVVGWPQTGEGACYNAVSILRDGVITATHHKHTLSASSALDERPWCAEGGEGACLFELHGIRIGILIGQDLHTSAPLSGTVAAGAELVLVPAALPFERGRRERRDALIAQRARESGAALAYVNLVGVQDALVFEGASICADGDGRMHPAARAFCDQWLIADYLPGRRAFAAQVDNDAPAPADEALIWRALTRAIADYRRKNGFSNVWLGLSGGLDSALVLALAVDALGAEQVSAVRMPSRYTADLSNELAQAQCDTLGVKLLTLPVEKPFQGFLDTLGEVFQGQQVDATEENLQSRVRGSLLMALSNKFGGLLLCTGNKSECAVGYATIYGDMCGGYAPISDLYKTEVYALANWRNAQGAQPVIPQEVIERAPSAELRPDQRDQDSLPPYDVLDAILYRHIEQAQSAAEIIAAGFEPVIVERVLRLVRASEWKRHQAAPGPKVSARAFATDRRVPISRGD